MLEVTSFEVAAQESYSHLLTNLPVKEAYRAVLEVEGDRLQQDNQLWSVPFTQGKINVALVSPEGNRFLSQAISIGNRVELMKMEELPKKPDELVDLWIFDRYVPEQLPEGNILFIAPNQSTTWHQATEHEVTQELEVSQSNHPILQYVDWSQIHVSSLAGASNMLDLEALVVSGEEDVVLAGTHKGQRIVVLNFDLHQSDFPLRHAFPIFMQNAISWLSAAQSLPIGTGSPGEALQLPLTLGAEERALIYPDGTKHELPLEATMHVYPLPELAGLYTLEEHRGNEQLIRYFSVQMKSSESDISPRDLPIHSNLPNLDVEDDSQEGHAKEQQESLNGSEKADGVTGNKMLTFWVTLLALLIAMTEWMVYQRGY